MSWSNGQTILTMTMANVLLSHRAKAFFSLLTCQHHTTLKESGKLPQTVDLKTNIPSMGKWHKRPTHLGSLQEARHVRGQPCPRTGVSADRGVREQGCLQAGVSEDTLSQSAYRPGRGALFFPNEKRRKSKNKNTYYI